LADPVRQKRELCRQPLSILGGGEAMEGQRGLDSGVPLRPLSRPKSQSLGYQFLSLTDSCHCFLLICVHLAPSMCCAVEVPRLYYAEIHIAAHYKLLSFRAQLRLSAGTLYHLQNTFQTRIGGDYFYKNMVFNFLFYFYYIF
jgi:hypothetical protein